MNIRLVVLDAHAEDVLSSRNTALIEPKAVQNGAGFVWAIRGNEAVRLLIMQRVSNIQTKRGPIIIGTSDASRYFECWLEDARAARMTANDPIKHADWDTFILMVTSYARGLLDAAGSTTFTANGAVSNADTR